MADFFDKVRDGVDKGIKTVSSKSKEFIEVTRLRSQIKDADSQINAGYRDLGKKAYEMMNRGALASQELKGDCEKIAALYCQINELEEGIRKAELEAARARLGMNVKSCPGCGTFNNESDKFCTNCGSPMAAVAVGRTCICGEPIKNNSKFCIKCGTKIGE
ncbi:MAG: zinc-ribbon domain-containing protein [Nitrospirota bacterium]